MILHDRVTVLNRQQVGEDEYGTPVYDNVETAFPAEVRPMTSEESPDTGATSTKYRVFLPPTAADLTRTDAVTWRGQVYEVIGDYEPHLVSGRLHHIEVVVQRRY